MTLTEQIRERLKAQDVSVRRISLDTEITRATIKSFLDGSSINSNTLDVLAKYVGAKIVFPDRPAKQKLAG